MKSILAVRKVSGAFSASFFSVFLLACGATGALAQNWLQEAPDHIPPGRSYASLAYDGAERNVVLFGGTGGTILADTWVWDGSDWTEKTPSVSPLPRIGAAMAFDAVHGQIVLFGGYNNTSPEVFYGDTWVWDGTNWTMKAPANSPSGRFLASMKFDSARGQMVLFGGEGRNASGQACSFGDTWVWNGTNWTQEELSTSPPARSEAAMAYDSSGGNIVLFGGQPIVNGGLGLPIGDTWIWNGSQWTQKHPATSPSARESAGMANYSEQGKVILFGGFGNSGYLNDTWSWNGSNWSKEKPQNSPTPRYGPSMAPDDANGNLVMFGGDAGAGTWIFANGPQVTLSANSLKFANQKVKTSSSAETITINNTGVTNLTIHSVSFTGADKGDFTETNNCKGTLKIGFSCTINVRFKPAAKGARSAKLAVSDNSESGSQTVSLSGTGD